MFQVHQLSLPVLQGSLALRDMSVMPFTRIKWHFSKLIFQFFKVSQSFAVLFSGLGCELSESQVSYLRDQIAEPILRLLQLSICVLSTFQIIYQIPQNLLLIEFNSLSSGIFTRLLRKLGHHAVDMGACEGGWNF